MGISDVEVDHRNARLQHGCRIAERLGCQRVEGIGEARMTELVSNDVAVEVLDRTARRDGRLYVDVTIEGLESDITVGFIGQQVGRPVSAKRTALCAMNRDAEPVS